ECSCWRGHDGPGDTHRTSSRRASSGANNSGSNESSTGGSDGADSRGSLRRSVASRCDPPFGHDPIATRAYSLCVAGARCVSVRVAEIEYDSRLQMANEYGEAPA